MRRLTKRRRADLGIRAGFGCLVLGLGLCIAPPTDLRAASAFAAPQASDKEEGKAILALKRAFKSEDRAKREAAIDGILPFDSEKTAKALVQAWERCEFELRTRDAAREELWREYENIVKGQEQTGERILQSGPYKRIEELKKELTAARKEIDARRALLDLVAEKLRRLRDEKAARWMLTKVVGDRKRTLSLKLAAVGALPGLGTTLIEDLRKALVKQKKVPDVLALLDGIAGLAEKARPIGADLVKLLTHNDPLVRGKSALTCAAVRVPESVQPMIVQLSKERGQLRRRIANALEEFTGKRLGVSRTSWEGWFESEGRAWVGAGAPRKMEGGRGVFSAAKEKRDEGRYYMGIPQDGEGIVYVIDASESMKKPVKWRKPRPKGGGVTVAGPIGETSKGNATTRLEACKQELIEALSRLERGKRFNVVWYSDISGAWKPSLQKADPAKVQDAISWVQRLQPVAWTNIHDAMKTAFDLDSPGGLADRTKKRKRRSKKRGIGVDTIFLLTDGSPTTSNGQPDDPEKVIRAVRSWNPLGRVVVHTIGIGNGLNIQFLSKLARENGGQFKHYDDSGRQR